MGSKERRTRERQERQQMILATAQEIAAADGWQAVTIRKIAAQIEYSPPTIYEHFANKDAILFALLRVGFAQLADALRDARNVAHTPDEQIISMALAYGAFAWRHPELYQVMHGLGGAAFTVEHKPTEIDAAAHLLREGLRAFEHAHQIHLPDVTQAVDILWATAHGIVALTMAERIPGHEAATRLLIAHAIGALLAAWRTGAT